MKKSDIRENLHALDLERKKILRPRFMELGLTVGEGQPRILRCLLNEGKMTQKELADRCMVDVTTMSRTLDRMEKAGFLKREPNPECRRSHLISITSQGKEKAQKVQEIFEQLDEELCRGMHAEEIESLLKALKKLRGNLEQAEASREKEEV